MSAPAPQMAPSALAGFTNAASYDSHRPSYPPESVETLLKQLKVDGVKGARILELAAGTGKFTELLAARPEGYEILAVEPHAEMRAQLQAKAAARGWTSVKIEEGMAEDMGKVADTWADALIIAQAFHWFATMPVLREIHRVMAPGAVLGLIWNIEDYNSQLDSEAKTDYEKKLKELTWSLDDHSKRFRHLAWRQVFDDQLKSDPVSIHAANPLFSLPLGEHVSPWEVLLSEEAAWARMHTISHIANLQGEQAENAKKSAFAAYKEAPKNDKGELAIHGNTYTYWTTAIPGDTLKSGG